MVDSCEVAAAPRRLLLYLDATTLNTVVLIVLQTNLEATVCTLLSARATRRFRTNQIVSLIYCSITAAPMSSHLYSTDLLELQSLASADSKAHPYNVVSFNTGIYDVL